MEKIIKFICYSIVLFVSLTYFFNIGMVRNESVRIAIGLLSIAALITLGVMDYKKKKSLN